LFQTGERIDSADNWYARRAPEIALLFSPYVYGYAPEPPPVTTAERARHLGSLDGAADILELDVAIGEVHTGVVVFLPTTGSGPFPWMIGLNKCGNHTLTDAPDVAVPTSWPDPACGEDAGETGRGSKAAEWPITAALSRGVAVVSFAQSDLDPDDPDEEARVGGVRAALPMEGPHASGSVRAWAWGISRG
jgi:hypothetical protein